MNTPLVSVCIITFNHERYIYDCIMSVIAQRDNHTLEILVGDDNSDDNTPTIITALVKEYPNIIRYFRRTKRGATENYKKLISEASGTFIAHLDGDDFWLPGKLSAQIHFLEQHPDCPVVYTNALVITDTGMPVGLFNNLQQTQFNINELLSFGNFLNNSSACYRSAMRENILEMQDPILDYRIHLCFARHGDIGYLNQALTCYRYNSNTSIIVHANERIRHFYWEAILSVPIDAVDTNALAQGMSEFARSVFFHSLRIRKMSLLRQWLPVVLKAAPVGKTKMLLLIFAAIVRVGTQEGIAFICAKLSRNHMKILYRR